MFSHKIRSFYVFPIFGKLEARNGRRTDGRSVTLNAVPRDGRVTTNQ